MSDKTKIEWADASWNPIRGTKGRWSCVKISSGCAHCYAERLNLRFGGPPYKAGADELRLDEDVLTLPLHWRKPRRIFVQSMSDLFEERVSDEWIDAAWGVMAKAYWHTYLLLTKRAERMQRYLTVRAAGGRHVPWPMPHIWLGVTVESPDYYYRIEWLLKSPAVVRFVSLEPLLGPLDLLGRGCLADHEWDHGVPGGINWVIASGESGGPLERALVQRVRPQDRQAWTPKPEALKWVRALRDQCQAAGVPFFFKQWGGPTPKSGGRLLDGKTCDDFPR